MSLTNLFHNGIHYDSDEEVFVSMWLKELQDAGYVKSYKKSTVAIPLTPGLKIPYQKITQLKTKLKVENKEHIILRPSEYTPDFEVEWTLEGFTLFVNSIMINDFIKSRFLYAFNCNTSCMIEVKPGFDQNNMTRDFVTKQKYIWDKLKVFVNLVEPVELFQKTFLPLEAAKYFRYKKAPTGKNRNLKRVGDYKFDFEPKTLKQYLEWTQNITNTTRS